MKGIIAECIVDYIIRMLNVCRCNFLLDNNGDINLNLICLLDEINLIHVYYVDIIMEGDFLNVHCKLYYKGLKCV